jgi:hypothetical protein
VPACSLIDQSRYSDRLPWTERNDCVLPCCVDETLRAAASCYVLCASFHRPPARIWWLLPCHRAVVRRSRHVAGPRTYSSGGIGQNSQHGVQGRHASRRKHLHEIKIERRLFRLVALVGYTETYGMLQYAFAVFHPAAACPTSVTGSPVLIRHPLNPARRGTCATPRRVPPVARWLLSAPSQRGGRVSRGSR